MPVRNSLYVPFAAVCVALAPLFSSCGDGRPSEVLSEKKMARLLADMEIAEAYADMTDHSSAGPDYRLELGKSVLAAHDVSQEQLDTTLAWYGRNLDDYADLYAKVDKEILARKKKLLNLDDEEMRMQEGDILWKYGKNGLLSSLGTADSWIFSVDDPELQPGDRIRWNMHVDVPAQFGGVLGVEYEDGTSEAATDVFVGRNSLEVICQTDTGKTVKRIYGTMRLREPDRFPVFADSISVVRLPYDSMEYYSRRSNKRYGVPSVKKEVPREKTDSVASVSAEEILPASVPGGESAEKPKMWHADESLMHPAHERGASVTVPPRRTAPPDRRRRETGPVAPKKIAPADSRRKDRK